jgi:hypothetical protein
MAGGHETPGEADDRPERPAARWRRGHPLDRRECSTPDAKCNGRAPKLRTRTICKESNSGPPNGLTRTSNPAAGDQDPPEDDRGVAARSHRLSSESLLVCTAHNPCKLHRDRPIEQRDDPRSATRPDDDTNPSGPCGATNSWATGSDIHESAADSWILQSGRCHFLARWTSRAAALLPPTVTMVIAALPWA